MPIHNVLQSNRLKQKHFVWEPCRLVSGFGSLSLSPRHRVIASPCENLTLTKRGNRKCKKPWWNKQADKTPNKISSNILGSNWKFFSLEFQMITKKTKFVDNLSRFFFFFFLLLKLRPKELNIIQMHLFLKFLKFIFKIFLKLSPHSIP